MNWTLQTLNDTASVITANTSLSDGTHSWNINCTAGGVTNTSEIRNITIDSTAPNVTINLPSSGSNLTSTNVTLNITATDAIMGLDTCWYSLDSWATNTSFTPNTATSFIGNHISNTLDIACNDTLNNINSSESVSFYIFTPPAYISPTPASGTMVNDTYAYFNVTLNWSADNCSIHMNGTDVVMQQRNSTWYTINYTFTANGTYFWNVSCIETTTGYAGWGENRNLTINTTEPPIAPPEIYNEQPSGNPSYAPGTVSVPTSFNTNVIAICRYSASDTEFANMAEMSSTNGTLHQHTFTVSNGAYRYYFRCNDSYGNVNLVSESITWSVASGGGGGGGGEAPTPPPEQTFTLTPRLIEDGTDIPDPAILMRKEKKNYTLTSRATVDLGITIYVEGEEVNLPNGMRYNTRDMIQVIPVGETVLKANETKTIYLKATLPDTIDRYEKYRCKILVITSDKTETIDVTLSYGEYDETFWSFLNNILWKTTVNENTPNEQDIEVTLGDMLFLLMLIVFILIIANNLPKIQRAIT